MPRQEPTESITLGRRSLLRGLLLAGGALAVAAAQAGCSTASPEGSPRATASRTPSAGSGPSPFSTSRPRSRILLAYFSRAGENYYYGDRIDLEVGNTEVLVRIISRHLSKEGVDCDVYGIEAADPYPHDYDETVARNVREQDADARPEIANPLAAIDGYDVVLLGSPIWNVRPPMIMHTFAESYDFSGKTVHPFTTHAMSGLGTAERDYTTACRGATLGEGLAVRGEEVREAGPPAVASWLQRINLIGEAK
jgi:flavodoxin